MKLNLQATTKEERKVKAYLEANASEVLAEKINGGVRIQKDGKMLLNRKTLAGFLKYACDEAKKQAEKGASSACIDDDTVYGWAVHYFEEDSIEGTLYNEDGSDYKAPMPKVTAKAPAVKYTPPKPKPQKLSPRKKKRNHPNERPLPCTENIWTCRKNIRKPLLQCVWATFTRYSARTRKCLQTNYISPLLGGTAGWKAAYR